MRTEILNDVLHCWLCQTDDASLFSATVTYACRLELIQGHPFRQGVIRCPQLQHLSLSTTGAGEVIACELGLQLLPTGVSERPVIMEISSINAHINGICEHHHPRPEPWLACII